MGMRRKLSRAWSAEDIDRLRQLAAARWSAARIGARLRRSPRVVKIRAALHGIQLGHEQAEVSAILSAEASPRLATSEMRYQARDSAG